MGQTLSHGVYLPAEGERNCYSGLASNWNLLDTAIGDTAGKASATHSHGNITNDGKVGTTANLPLITGTGGAVQAGSFGNAANTFCEGNDSRLSDARTPVAHTHTKSDVTDLFNSANTWSGNNSYTGTVSLDSSSDVAEQFKQKLPKDVSTSNDAMARVNSLVDSAGHYVVVETLGHWSNYVAKNTTLKYKNDSTKQGAIEFRLYSDGTGILYPQSPFECDLGNTYNKWKSLNGINPGALSLPNLDSAVSLTTILQAAIDKTQTTNSWTANFTGILCINWITKNLTGPFRCSVYNASDIKNATWGQTFWADNVWYFIVSFPVQNGKTYYFDNTFTRTSEDSAHIVHSANAIYTLGNV